MTIFRWIIIATWLVFAAYWTITSFRVKPDIEQPSARRQSALRLAIVVVVVVTLRAPPVNDAMRAAQAYQADSSVLSAVGAALTLLGIALAVLARTYLGRNWGMPMSRKEGPELVTAGSYARVRHPIYTGILLAMLGSVIGESVNWLVPLLLFGAYFIYSARREEELMRTQFPESYPAYKKRTWMLVPFVW